MKKLIIFLSLIFISSSAFAQLNEKHTNQYIEGYAASILKEKYSYDAVVSVRSGEMYLPNDLANHAQYDAIVQDLSKIDGVTAIKLVEANESKRIARVWVLPNEPLYKKLIADPRSAEFSLSYHYYSKSDIMDNGINLNLGKTFPIIRAGLGDKAYTEIGLQAGAFTTFNIYNNNMSLVNTDVQLGVPVTIAYDSVSFTGRFYHQRSNAGSEYPDIDFNFEALDGLISFEPNAWFCIYAGLGLVLEADPIDYGPILYQIGTEFIIEPDNDTIPTSVLSIDVKGNQETHYNPSFSFIYGIEVLDNLMITAEIYTGRSYIGQFFEDKVTYFGIGTRIH